MTLIISKEDEWYVARCCEYNLVAQAKTIWDVLYEWGRLYEARILIGKELNIDPFEGATVCMRFVK